MSLGPFIFTPGIWLGEGKISFGCSPEFVKFYTRWHIEPMDSDGVIRATQTVEIDQSAEPLLNRIRISDITPGKFKIALDSNIAGHVEGTGLSDHHLIAWEFPADSEVAGFEVYTQQENGDYFLHAEYGSPEPFRTTIEGLIWLKNR